MAPAAAIKEVATPIYWKKYVAVRQLWRKLIREPSPVPFKLPTTMVSQIKSLFAVVGLIESEMTVSLIAEK